MVRYYKLLSNGELHSYKRRPKEEHGLKILRLEQQGSVFTATCGLIEERYDSMPSSDALKATIKDASTEGVKVEVKIEARIHIPEMIQFYAGFVDYYTLEVATYVENHIKALDFCKNWNLPLEWAILYALMLTDDSSENFYDFMMNEVTRFARDLKCNECDSNAVTLLANGKPVCNQHKKGGELCATTRWSSSTHQV